MKGQEAKPYSKMRIKTYNKHVRGFKLKNELADAERLRQKLVIDMITAGQSVEALKKRGTNKQAKKVRRHQGR